MGNSATVNVATKRLEDGFLTLLSVYYVLNVQYPISFCGVLAILQCYMIGDDTYEGFTSNAYKRFIPKIKRVIRDIQDQN